MSKHHEIAMYIASKLPEADEQDFDRIITIFNRFPVNVTKIETIRCNRTISDNVILVSYTRDLSDIYNPYYANGCRTIDYSTVTVETKWLIKGIEYNCKVIANFTVECNAHSGGIEGIVNVDYIVENNHDSTPIIIVDATKSLCPCHPYFVDEQQTEFDRIIEEISLEF